jgi:DNA polymerase elongation subunit (family B)
MASGSDSVFDSLEALGLRPAVPRLDAKRDLFVRVRDVLVTDGPLHEIGGRYCLAPDSSHDPVPRRDLRTTVVLFGTERETGATVAVRATECRPWFRFELPAGTDARRLVDMLRTKCYCGDAPVDFAVEQLPKLYGCFVKRENPSEWRPFPFVTVRVPSIALCRAMSREAEKMGLVLSDSRTSITTKALVDLGVNPTGWVRVAADRYEVVRDADSLYAMRATYCQLEVLTKWSADCVTTPDDPELDNEDPGAVLLSLDGEMQSLDREFPSVFKGDYTFCLGFYAWNTKTDRRAKIVLYVGDVTVPESDRDPDLLLLTFPSPRELLGTGVTLVMQALDPDLVTGWFVYGFDFPFLYNEYCSYFARSEDFLLSEDAERDLAQLAGTDGAPGLSCGKWWIGTRDYLKRLRRGLADEVWDGATRELGPTFTGRLRQQRTGELPAWQCRRLAELAVAAGAQKPAMTPSPSQLRRMMGEERWAAFLDRLKTERPGYYRILTLVREPGRRPALDWGRLRGDPIFVREKLMRSAAKGDQIYKMFATQLGNRTELPGRVQLDLMFWIKDDKKPASNSLKFAAGEWLGDDSKLKIELDKGRMFEIVSRADPAEQWEIARYCWQDAAIPVWLIEKLTYWPILVEMGSVCRTRINEVCNGGQQTRVYNLIANVVAPGGAKKLQGDQPKTPLPESGFAINRGVSGWPEIDTGDIDFEEEPAAEDAPRAAPAREKKPRLEADEAESAASKLRKKPDYRGATVLEPMPGFYREELTSSLDFASLYPSIMISCRLCFSTLVSDPDELAFLRTLDPRFFPLREYRITHICTDPSTGREVEFERVYVFADWLMGVLPRNLVHSLYWRRVVKKMMKLFKGMVRAILDGRQLALKLVCNSMYGFTGTDVNTGMMSCKPIAAAVTLNGRDMLQSTKRQAMAKVPGSVVVYGDTDSVMVKWPASVAPDIASAWEIGERVAREISESFQKVRYLPDGTTEVDKTIVLENEKVKKNFLLLDSKKTYAALEFEKAGDGFESELLTKGLDPVRRDRSLLRRETVEKVLHAIVEVGDDAAAVSAVLEALVGVCENTLGLEYYELSKETKQGYAPGQLVEQYEAWKRMVARGEEAPPLGSRMPFIITEGPGKQAERTEHPDHVRSAGLIPDRVTYLESLRKPLEKILVYHPHIPVNALVDASIAFVKGLQARGARASDPLRGSILAFGARSDGPDTRFSIRGILEGVLAKHTLGREQTKEAPVPAKKARSLTDFFR